MQPQSIRLTCKIINKLSDSSAPLNNHNAKTHLEKKVGCKKLSSFPRSPRLAKGAIVSLDLPSVIPQVIVFQYNPNTVSRTLTPMGPKNGKGSGNRSSRETSRLSGTPSESITLEIELDATDQLEHPDQNKSATMLGIHPQLAALEMILYPKVAGILLNKALKAIGTTQITPFESPFTIFIWGPKRVLPVRLTSLTINEQAHDTNLNPIRAAISVGLQVLSYSDFTSKHPGFYLFMAHHIFKEAMALVGTVNSISAVGTGEVSLINKFP